MAWHKYILIGFILFFGLFVMPAFAHAATKYANSSTGSDSSGDGSSGNPYQTFTKIYASSTAGDTLDLTGTFDWSSASETSDTSGSGFTLNKNLTIQGQGANSTFIQASSTYNTADRSVFTIASGKTITLKNLTIRYGKVTSGNSGGGITNNGTLTVQNCTITQNAYNTTSSYGAGGIFNYDSTTLTISTSTISSNTWNGTYYGSGGIYSNQSTTVTITASTLNGNAATSTNPSTFAYSYAEPSGAFGTYRFGTDIITNSTISGNSTNAYAGAIQGYYDSSFTLTNNTIVNNTATQGAGGILYESLSGSNMILKNNILANNTGGGTANDFYVVSGSAGMVTDNGYNIVEFSTNKTFSATGNITGDQSSLNLDSALAANGSSGPYTFALLTGSVAINAGTTSANSTVSIPTRDQRGATRSGATDIGAYEFGGGGIPDTTSPSVTFTSPTTSAIVSGSVTLTATSTDETAVAGVTFYVDSTTKIGSEITATSSPSTYTTTWTSSGVSDGAHSLIAVARDSSNNYATSSSVSITVDNTVPTVSFTAPTASSTVSGSISITATSTDVTSGVAGVKFYLDNVLLGSEDTSSPYSITYNTASSTNASHNLIAVARDNASNVATSSTLSFTIDNSTPSFSALSASSTLTGAVITWTSDSLTSTQVNFGLTTSYGTSTTESDTSPRVTSHSATISGLKSCLQYHFQAQGKNAILTTATSSDSTFITLGCTGNATVSATEQGTITTTAGGTLTSGNLTLTVPTSFTSTSTSATFQSNQLNATSFFNGAGRPSGKSSIGTNVFNLKALTDATTTLASFSTALTITLSYSASDASGYVESTFKIYRYDGSSWEPLSNCSVNTSAKTVTCDTTQFSDFSIFGDASSSGSGGGGGLPAIAFMAPEVPVGGFKIITSNLTNSPQVNLNFKILEDTTQVSLSNQPDFALATIEPIQKNKQWNLCNTTACAPGTYTVYAKFYTKWGQSSDIIKTDILYNPKLKITNLPKFLVLDKGTVYLIIGYTKYAFTSKQAFLGLGYSFKDVENQDSSNYELANNLITNPTTSHVPGSWIVQGKTVYFVSINGLIPIAEWQIFLNNGGNKKYIVKANSQDLLLPQLPLMTNSDSRVTQN